MIQQKKKKDRETRRACQISSSVRNPNKKENTAKERDRLWQPDERFNPGRVELLLLLFFLKPYSFFLRFSGKKRIPSLRAVLVRNISLNDPRRPSQTNHPACHQKLHEATKRFIPVEIMLSFFSSLPPPPLRYKSAPVRSLFGCSVARRLVVFFFLSSLRIRRL